MNNVRQSVQNFQKKIVYDPYNVAADVYGYAGIGYVCINYKKIFSSEIKMYNDRDWPTFFPILIGVINTAVNLFFWPVSYALLKESKR